MSTAATAKQIANTVNKTFTAKQIKEHLQARQEVIIMPNDPNAFAVIYYMWAGDVFLFSPDWDDREVDSIIDPDEVDDVCEYISGLQRKGYTVYIRGEARPY